MTNNIKVAPIKTKNPVQADVMHIFSKVSMTPSPMQHNNGENYKSSIPGESIP